MRVIKDTYIKIPAVTILCLILSTCGDGIKDKNPSERMHREAGCVISAQHFSLFDEAETHYNHGLEANRDHYSNTGNPNQDDFHYILKVTRTITQAMSSQFHALNLRDRCNRRIKNVEFNQGKN